MSYQSGPASLFSLAARSKPEIKFTCVMFCQVGPYSLHPGDKLIAVACGEGLYDLFCDWSAGCLGRLTGRDVNKLAGREVAS